MILNRIKHIDVGGMCEAKYGLDTLKRIRDERLGNYAVLFVGSWSMEQLREVVTFCKKHNIRFVMDEMWRRTQPFPRPGYAGLDKEEFRTLIDDACDVFDGSLFMCEYGGLAAYWPLSTVEGSPNIIPPTDCAAEAKANMITKLQELIDKATTWLVPRPLVVIEASPMAKYLYEAGIDRVDLEITYNRFTEVGYSATRGATKAYDKKHFGVDMAMVWYGGNQHDSLWLHRWKVSLYHAFIRGADPIYAEHGVMDYKARGKSYETDDPEVKMFRKELAEFSEFCRMHPRPSGFPKSRIAVIHGNLDSFAENTIGQPYVWGQRDPQSGIKVGYPEYSWELFNVLYQNKSWEFPYRSADIDLSGNPPWGQVDAIPAESALSLWQQYDAVIFLGWNTMTSEIYSTMSDYVAGGGHLLASLVHLDKRSCRTDPIDLINGGDLSELFGVRVNGLDAEVTEGIKFKQQPSCGNYLFPAWTDRGDPMYPHGGFPAASLELLTAELIAAGSDRFTDTWVEMDNSPVITANSYGKGMAILLNALEYPAHPGIRQLYKDLLMFFTDAHHGDLHVEANERVRYGVFQDEDMYILYALNTDHGLRQEIKVTFGQHERVPFLILPGEMTAVYLTPSLLACPKSVSNRIMRMNKHDDIFEIYFYEKTKEFDVCCYENGELWHGEIKMTKELK